MPRKYQVVSNSVYAVVFEELPAGGKVVLEEFWDTQDGKTAKQRAEEWVADPKNQ